MTLSKNFTWAEMLRSDTALTYDYVEQFRPSDKTRENIKTMVKSFLQPLRDYFGRPIRITSGYRSKRLNDKIGGSKTSDHMRGMAADLDSKDNLKLFNLIKDNHKFTQLIWYYQDDVVPDFIHVSYNPDNLKNEILICKLVEREDGLKRIYLKWEGK